MPAALIYILVIVIPSFYSFYLSFYKWNGVAAEKVFVGLQNYITLINVDKVFFKAITNNVIWVVLVMVFTVGVSLSIAILLNRAFKGRTLFRGIFYFPYILSGIVVAIIWQWIYNPQLGLLHGLLKLFNLSHLSKAWLADPQTALYAVYVAALWQGIGAPMVLFLAGLQTIPKDLYEAALIDGAGSFHILRSITIPMLRETFVIVFATQIISAMKVYDIIWGMTAGGPARSTQTMATWTVMQTFDFANLGMGTAIAVIMVLVMMIIIIPYVIFMARD